jgi:choline dehydrogenase
MANKKNFSRREFVKTSASAVALSAVAGCATLDSSESARKLAGGSEDEFDYVVIGSGAGGGPVAVNLAKAGYRVCLLEAGGNAKSRDSEVPAFHGKATEDANIAWSFFVKHYSNPEKQKMDPKYTADKGGVLYPRGATLGGSTAINAMITLAPDNQDWEDLVKLTGDTTWNSERMRDYFERVENMGYARPLIGNPQRHGLNGWLTTEQNNISLLLDDSKIATTALAALQAEGIFREATIKVLQKNILLDPNSWNYVQNKRDGAFNIPKSTKLGKRNGTREHILRAMAEYPDRLFVRLNAVATKIILEGAENRASGVEYLEGANLYQANPQATPSTARSAVARKVSAKKEVILSGGAFNSPQLLMLSGIGSRDELQSHGIEVRAHVPGVGKNLQDRYEASVVTRLKNDFDVLKDCTFGADGDPCLAEYAQDPTGSVYATNGAIIALIKKSQPNRTTPDLCIFALPGRFTGYYPGWSKESLRRNYLTWAVLKGHTRNQAGTVSLKSADPLATPEINFRYFDEGSDLTGEDMDAVIKGMQIAQRVNAQAQMKVFIAEEELPKKTGEELRTYLKHNSWGHHASCTNKMGAAGDPNAVVDSKFRVRGTKGLRVVDASVFPRTPGLFIVMAIYMIAEKASDEILADAKKQL